jgi:hypothetical protein
LYQEISGNPDLVFSTMSCVWNWCHKTNFSSDEDKKAGTKLAGSRTKKSDSPAESTKRRSPSPEKRRPSRSPSQAQARKSSRSASPAGSRNGRGNGSRDPNRKSRSPESDRSPEQRRQRDRRRSEIRCRFYYYLRSGFKVFICLFILSVWAEIYGQPQNDSNLNMYKWFFSCFESKIIIHTYYISGHICKY